VQIRALSCLAGGLLGIGFAPVLNTTLGLPPAMAFAGFALAGVALGYAVSLIIDAFSASHGDDVSHE